jgi:hypothetical protein
VYMDSCVSKISYMLILKNKLKMHQQNVFRAS